MSINYKLASSRLPRTWQVFLIVFLLTGLLMPATAQQDAIIQNPPDDESQLIPIRLAARGGDFKLAQQRLAALNKPQLVAKGTAALAAEYAHIDDVAKATELFQAAIKLTETSSLINRERVSAYLQIATLIHEQQDKDPNWEQWSIEVFEQAIATSSTMSGLDLDLALVELAQRGLVITGDIEQTKSLFQLVSDASLREKMLALYGFTPPEAASEQ